MHLSAVEGFPVVADVAFLFARFLLACPGIDVVQCLLAVLDAQLVGEERGPRPVALAVPFQAIHLEPFLALGELAPQAISVPV